MPRCFSRSLLNCRRIPKVLSVHIFREAAAKGAGVYVSKVAQCLSIVYSFSYRRPVMNSRYGTKLLLSDGNSTDNDRNAHKRSKAPSI